MESICEQVKADFSTTSTVTVYKTAALLKELNEVLELGFPEGGNRYDGNKPNPLACGTCQGSRTGGYFEVTADVARYTRAKFLSEIGKRTEVFVRVSAVGGEKGTADAARDPRVFAVKFYTEEGNYDMVGNNTPAFFIRDTIKFPDFIHTQKRNPVTNLPPAQPDQDSFPVASERLRLNAIPSVHPEMAILPNLCIMLRF